MSENRSIGASQPHPGRPTALRGFEEPVRLFEVRWGD